MSSRACACLPVGRDEPRCPSGARPRPARAPRRGGRPTRSLRELPAALRASSGRHAEAARNVVLTILLAHLLADAGHDGPPHGSPRAPRRTANAAAAQLARARRAADGRAPALTNARASRPLPPMHRQPCATAMDAPGGIPGSGPHRPVAGGPYAAALRERLRGFTRVQVFGEVFGFKAGRAKVWFELRDAAGALPCSMWREDFDALRLGPLADGAQVVAAGGCDYYPGSRTASPAFSFAVTPLRIAGEGDLLAQLERLRRELHAEGLFEPQKPLPRPALPRTIGVVTGEYGKARDDVLAGPAPARLGGAARVGVRARAGPPRRARGHARAAGPRRLRGGRGDRRRARRRLARRPVRVLRRDAVPHGRAAARAGDLLGRPPHRPHAARRRRRRRLLDADPRRRGRRPVDCAPPARALAATAARLERQGRRAVLERARTLARLSRAPGHHVARHRTRLHQQLRELRAATRRARRRRRARDALARDGARAQGRAPRRPRRDARGAARAPTPPRSTAPRRAALERRRRDLDRMLATLAAHDPQRTLERGYALLEDPAGEPVTSADAARAQPTLTLRLHDGRVDRPPRRRACPHLRRACRVRGTSTSTPEPASAPAPTPPLDAPYTTATAPASPPAPKPALEAPHNPASASPPAPTPPLDAPDTSATATASPPDPEAPHTSTTAFASPPTPSLAASPVSAPSLAADAPAPAARTATAPPTPVVATPPRATAASSPSPAPAEPLPDAAAPAATPPPASATTPPPATAAARAAKRPRDDDAEPRLFGP